MSNVIDFLERLGQDADLRRASRVALEQAVADAHLSPAVSTAILDDQPGHLEAALGAAGNVCCMIANPRLDEDDEEETRKAADADDDDAMESAPRRVATAR